MQIITDSGKVHWAIGKHITCPQCETVFCLEAKEDFRRYPHDVHKIGLTCPKEGCGYFFHHSKPIKLDPYSPLKGGTSTPWIQPNVPKITYNQGAKVIPPDVIIGIGNSLVATINKLNNTRARSPTSR